MQQTPGFSRPLFREATAKTVEGQEPAMHVVDPSTTSWLSHQPCFASAPCSGRVLRLPCDQSAEPSQIQGEESTGDFFGIEDLLAQAYEDEVYGGLLTH